MIAVGTLPLTNLLVCEKVNPQPDGTVTVSNVDGTVRSWQPGGYWETRPAGTAGGYEKALIVGGMLLYNSVAPDGSSWPACFAYFEKVPNQ